MQCAVYGYRSGSDGTGVLFNLDGEVIGLISSKIWDDEDESTANAYAISDLKTTIELLANGDSVPYIGIYGTAVTSAIQKEQGIPEGHLRDRGRSGFTGDGGGNPERRCDLGGRRRGCIERRGISAGTVRYNDR